MRNKIGVVLWMTAFSFLAGCGASTDNTGNTKNAGNQVLETQTNQVSFDNQDNLSNQGNIDSQGNSSNQDNLKNQEKQNIQENGMANEKIATIETDATIDKSEIEKPKDNRESADKKRLTLDKVLELSKKENLDWSDFEGYACEDVGFGLYILRFDIDKDFYLLVGGTGQGKPMYVRLVSVKDKDKYIEIGNKDKGEENKIQVNKTQISKTQMNKTQTSKEQISKEQISKEQMNNVQMDSIKIGSAEINNYSFDSAINDGEQQMDSMKIQNRQTDNMKSDDERISNEDRNFRTMSDAQSNPICLERAKEVEDFIRENKGTSYFVSIIAYIKEIKENGILIRSEANEFPGVFSVVGVRDAMADEEYWKLKGGIRIRILMEDGNRKSAENDSIPIYKAKEVVILSDGEDEDAGQEDILLLNVPKLELYDPLSSLYNPYYVQSGNYTWTVREGEEEKQIAACGVAPLEETNMQKKLKLPHYSSGNSIHDTVVYMYSLKKQPDILTLSQWDIEDVGNDGAKEEKIIVYYGKTNIIELQKDKIYEFTANWGKVNYSQNQFYGTASYVVATE